MKLLHIESPFARALVEYFRELETRLDLRQPVKAWVAGGMAVNMYTGQRITGDIDAEFSARIMPPRDLVIEATHSDGQKSLVWFDSSYNPMFALLHEDYQTDAIPLELGLNRISAYILAPVDLAVSKIGRFSDTDKCDIIDLARAGLIEPSQLATRTNEALIAYPGSTGMITYNLRDALADIAGFTVDHVALYNAAKPTSQLIAAVITRFLAAREQESGAPYSAQPSTRAEVHVARNIAGPPGSPDHRLIDLIDARAAARELRYWTPQLPMPQLAPKDISSISDMLKSTEAPRLARRFDTLARARSIAKSPHPRGTPNKDSGPER